MLLMRVSSAARCPSAVCACSVYRPAACPTANGTHEKRNDAAIGALLVRATHDVAQWEAAQCTMVTIMARRGDTPGALVRLTDHRVYAQGHRAHDVEATTLLFLSWASGVSNDRASARHFAEEALDVATRLASTTFRSALAMRARLRLGEIAEEEGDFKAALVHYAHAKAHAFDANAARGSRFPPREAAELLTKVVAMHLAMGDTKADAIEVCLRFAAATQAKQPPGTPRFLPQRVATLNNCIAVLAANGKVAEAREMLLEAQRVAPWPLGVLEHNARATTFDGHAWTPMVEFDGPPPAPPAPRGVVALGPSRWAAVRARKWLPYMVDISARLLGDGAPPLPLGDVARVLATTPAHFDLTVANVSRAAGHVSADVGWGTWTAGEMVAVRISSTGTVRLDAKGPCVSRMKACAAHALLCALASLVQRAAPHATAPAMEQIAVVRISAVHPGISCLSFDNGATPTVDVHGLALALRRAAKGTASFRIAHTAEDALSFRCVAGGGSVTFYATGVVRAIGLSLGALPQVLELYVAALKRCTVSLPRAVAPAATPAPAHDADGWFDLHPDVCLPW